MPMWNVNKWIYETDNPTRLAELLDFLIEDYKPLGEGAGRIVYKAALWPNTVLKIATNNNGVEQNINEHIYWISNKDFPIARWLAPVHYRSGSGLYLLQALVGQPPSDKQMPVQVPLDLVSDSKPENMGWLDDRWVFCDYGTIDVSNPDEPELVNWEEGRREG